MMPLSSPRSGPGVRPVYIIGSSEAAAAADIGRKAYALASLKTAGFVIPEWFVVSPLAFDVSLSDAERMSLAAAARATARFSLLSNLSVAASVRVQLDEALRALCPHGEQVAVRSSAADEDAEQRSFAGQFETHLCVSPGDVAPRIVDVWRSGFSERVLNYRRAQGLTFPTRAPAVIVQRQLEADAAGVAFGADPVSGRRMVAVVAAVPGLGSALISGEAASDTFHVSRDGRIIDRTIGAKQVIHRCAPGDAAGVRAIPLANSEQRAAAIDDRRACEVAELARRAGRHFAAPQDIEWAIERGRLYLLQSRPITALSALADPDAAQNIWDNANVAESYPGITSPLTFSFIRYVYEEVYRELCRLLGVPSRVLAAHDDTFARMLGLIRGRVYYNLLSWYRLLATLPGFTLNRRFMEQMMGVSDGVPDDAIGGREPAGLAEKALDAIRVTRTTIGLAWHCARLPASIRRFRARLGAALGASDPSFADARLDEIVAHYRSLERQLLKRWDAPLVNDFFAMMFYGVLRRLIERWCGDQHRTLQNDLIVGEGGVVSTEPAVRIRAMAEIAAGTPSLVDVLCTGSPDEIAEAMRSTSELRAAFESYVATFGDRSFEELKLETLTLADDPLPALRAIGQLARSIQHGGSAVTIANEAQAGRAAGLRAAAEARVQTALAGKPIRRIIFKLVVSQARARVRDRENLRFERTRVFGRVRRIFRRVGQELAALGVLTDPADVFYLHVDEVLGFVEGTAVSTDLKGLAALRRAEYARYAADGAPDDRFETRGAVYAGNAFRRGSAPAAPQPSGDSRGGLACCPGIVEAPVVVVRDPRHAVSLDGSILVAERTDPAWVVLFASARGLLVERGSVLSHSAIIAREMGVPTIVNIAGLTGWLEDGDWVRMDGGTGVVQRVSAREAGHAG